MKLAIEPPPAGGARYEVFVLHLLLRPIVSFLTKGSVSDEHQDDPDTHNQSRAV